ncbi:MAG: sigma-70 family RNA polymerase sigma factor [Acidobacteriota bacterium]
MKSDKRDSPLHLVSVSFSDTEILEMFHQDADAAWRIFIDRHADTIFSSLRYLGFDYDQAMDRFIYICEKLCEDDFRRLKGVRYAGTHGDLIPWLRQVVKNLSINWVWSQEGRKRLLKPIKQLPARDQRIFELYFWKGLLPSAIQEELQREQAIELVEVMEALERIFAALSQKKLWRLLSNLARQRGVVSLEENESESGIGIQPVFAGASPEEALIYKETQEHLDQALTKLTARERLTIQLRFEDCRTHQDIAELLQISDREVKSCLRGALKKLATALK